MRRPTSSGSSAPASSGSGSSTTSPPASRALLRALAPSTTTAPSASSSSAAAREPIFGRPARKRSRRTPAASLGTSTRYLERSDTSRLTVGEQQRADQDGDAGDDERVGEIERRPVAEVEEIGDVPEPDAIGQIRDAAAEEQAERDRQDRVPATRSAEEDDHPAHGDGSQDNHARRRRRKEAKGDSGVLHVVDRERADHVDRLAEGERRRDDRLRHLVGRNRGPRDGDQRDPLAQSRAKRAPGAPLRNHAVRGRPHPDLRARPAGVSYRSSFRL